MPETVTIKPYKLCELADLNGLKYRTFKKILSPFKDEIGEPTGQYYSCKQVKKIFELTGYPTKIII